VSTTITIDRLLFVERLLDVVPGAQATRFMVREVDVALLGHAFFAVRRGIAGIELGLTLVTMTPRSATCLRTSRRIHSDVGRRQLDPRCRGSHDPNRPLNRTRGEVIQCPQRGEVVDITWG